MALASDSSVLILLLGILVANDGVAVKLQTIYSFVSYIVFSGLLYFYSELSFEWGTFFFPAIFVPERMFASFGAYNGIVGEIAIFAFNWAIFGLFGVIATWSVRLPAAVAAKTAASKKKQS